jgi:Ca-activated chloride channel family protein
LSGIAVPQVNPSGSLGQPPTWVVSVPFVVDDGHGNPVTGITPADLSIFDDKKAPQNVVALRSAKEMPLRLGLLIDTSNSQGSSALYAPGVRAASDFLIQVLSNPDDKAFIVSFSDKLHETNFMNRDEFLKFKLTLYPGGASALYDAINLACAERMKTDLTQPARRVLVILSDGDDNMSRITRSETIAVAQGTGTVIFTISTGQQPLGDKVLRRLTLETGGYSFSNLNPADMPKVFAEIKARIERMYSVTYLPAESGTQGQFRSIELKITSNKKWKVRAPTGYYAPAPSR